MRNKRTTVTKEFMSYAKAYRAKHPRIGVARFGEDLGICYPVAMRIIKADFDLLRYKNPKIVSKEEVTHVQYLKDDRGWLTRFLEGLSIWQK